MVPRHVDDEVRTIDADPRTTAIRDADVGGEVLRAVLPGVVRWAEELVVGDARAVLLVGGVEPVPGGARLLDLGPAQPGVTPDALVIVAGPDVALVIAATAGSPLASWAAGAAAIRAVLDDLDLPPGSGAIVEQAMAQAPQTGGHAVGPLLTGLDHALRRERQAVAALLHDGPVQDLTAAQLLLDSAMWGPSLSDDVLTPLKQSLAALRAAITGARGLMGELSGPHSSDGGP